MHGPNWCFTLLFFVYACVHATLLHVACPVRLFEILWTGSSVHGILQARILKWVGISSSKGSSWSGDQTLIWQLLPWQTDSLPLWSPRKPLFCLYPLTFLGCWPFPLQVWDVWSKHITQGTHKYVIPRFLSPHSLICSIYLSECYIFSIYSD